MKSTLRGSLGDNFCMRLASMRMPRTPTMGTGASMLRTVLRMALVTEAASTALRSMACG
ncbi:hypothetical protein D9M68_566300 [compost metagenome]